MEGAVAQPVSDSDPNMVQTDEEEDDPVAPAPTLPPKKRPPTMDITVHRLRHLQFHPKPIVCLQALNSHGYLALSRENGHVELRDVQKLRTLATVTGFRKKPVNVMAWLCSDTNSSSESSGDRSLRSSKTGTHTSWALPPLVGASNDGTVFCIDFSQKSLTHMIPSGGGAVFALTTKCRRCPCQGSCCSLVAGGCQDGATRIWRVNLTDHDLPLGLSLVSTVPSAGAPVLSLAWRPKNSSTTEGSSVLYAAIADGTIRRYDETLPLQWSSTLRMTLECLGRTTPTRVWALEALGDGTLVSADSLGHVQMWSGDTGTLQQTIDQNENKADVLCLAVSADEKKIYASGVDSRVICIEPVPHKRQDAEGYYGPMNKWMLSHAHRPHTHDVNALAIVMRGNKHTESTPDRRTDDARELLFSGGIDTKICTYSVHEGRKRRPKTSYPWPSNLVTVARTRRALVMLREESIDIYRLGPKQSHDENFPVSFPPEKTLIGTVHVEGATNLMCAAISDDGKFLALSDALSVSVFHLDYILDGDLLIGMHQPKKVIMEAEVPFAASCLCFQRGRSDLICSSLDGSIRIVSIVENAELDLVCKVLQVVDPEPNEKEAAERIALSRDGAYFASLQTIHARGSVNIFRVLPTGACVHWWTVPPTTVPPCAISFLESEEPQLAVACVNFGVYVFSAADRCLSSWSESMGYPIKSLPTEFSHRNDYPVRIATNIGSPDKFLVVRSNSRWCLLGPRARTLFQHILFVTVVC